MVLLHPNKIKLFARVIFILNLACLIFGILYAVSPNYNIAWDIFGGVLFATIFGDMFLVYIIDKGIDKTSRQGRRLNRGSYVFLFWISMTMLGMMIGNFLVSTTYITQTQQMFNCYALVFGSYFGLLGGGLLFSLAGLCYFSVARQVQASPEIVPTQSPIARGGWRAIRIMLIVGDCTLLGWGVYFCINTLWGAELGVGAEFHELGVFGGMMGVFVPMWSVFWGIIMLSTALFLIKLTQVYRKPKLSWAFGIIGLVVTGIMLVPPVATLAYTSEADATFAGAFGADWHSKINASTDAYFLQTRFAWPGYFLGIPQKNCIVIKDVLFYDGNTGLAIDAGIKLYFDAYLPPSNGIGLPGANSTLIRIHGGGWVMGDKGLGDMMEMNTYFAAQGYCVFDIQYGLNNDSNIFLSELPIMAANVLGNFTVDDMVRHIGLFCKNLTANNIYGANLNSVFVSGGSAGGHLTCATALAIASKNYTDWFGTGLTVKGYVPFYPGNGMAGFLGPSKPELVDPALLVNESSPACLVFQGTEDGLVYPGVSQVLKDTYTAHNNNVCAVLWMPLSGHAGDLYFSGFYNQFFLYYMERFLFLYR